jgi:hypothetical protein
MKGDKSDKSVGQRKCSVFIYSDRGTGQDGLEMLSEVLMTNIFPRRVAVI